MNVRPANAADLDSVTEIKVRNWADTYRELLDEATLAPFLDLEAQARYMRAIAARPTTLLLVAEDGTQTITGFALTYLDHEPDPWLESLHVLARHRGRGVGTLLMRATARELVARRCTGLRLGVVEGNDAAERFYERLGATLVGREPADWAQGVWHVVYRWSDLDALSSRNAG